MSFTQEEVESLKKEACQICFLAGKVAEDRQVTIENAYLAVTTAVIRHELLLIRYALNSIDGGLSGGVDRLAARLNDIENAISSIQ